jgi:predicted TIM-barrel enzyme
MSRFLARFPHPALFVAVHVRGSITEAVEDAHDSIEAGADGVFFVNHGSRWTLAHDAYRQARQLMPHAFLGVNFLGLEPPEALRHMPAGVSAWWIDDSHINESYVDNDEMAAAYLRGLRRRQLDDHPDVLFFPSVAMKHVLPATKDPERVARLAAPHADVVMTSGERTGSAPPIEKLAAVVRGAGSTPAGNCSGTSIHNVWACKAAGVRVFIANTAIADEHERPIPDLVTDLANAVHSP